MTLALSAQNLSKSFDGFQANKDITFSLEKGELLAIIGPNGAGKTTLINQLSGETLPDDGTFFIGTHDMTVAKPWQRNHAGLARSYQVTSLFSEMTVLENVALSVHAHRGRMRDLWIPWQRKTVISSEAKRLLEEVGLKDSGDRLISDLSHGEHRQVELAMSLGSQPEILLLDEPLAGLGHAESRQMIEQLRHLKGQYSIILIEHDMAAVFSLADRVLVLSDGQIIAEGSAEEVRSNSQVKSVYLGREDANA